MNSQIKISPPILQIALDSVFNRTKYGHNFLFKKKQDKHAYIRVRIIELTVHVKSTTISNPDFITLQLKLYWYN